MGLPQKSAALSALVMVTVMMVLLIELRDCEGKKHDHHHHPHRSRRHHHESDFFETGATHHSKSDHLDTVRRLQHSPTGHHHHVKGHHLHNEDNKHQHFVTEQQSYETRYETSYSENYGDDYGGDDEVPVRRVPEERVYVPHVPPSSADDGEVFLQPVQLDQDSMHNSQVATKIKISPRPKDSVQKDADNVDSSTTKIKLEQNVKNENPKLPKSPTRTEVPIEIMIRGDGELTEGKDRNKKNNPPEIDDTDLSEMMMNDAVPSRSKNLISSQKALTQRQAVGDVATKGGGVQANGLVKSHPRPKAGVSAIGAARWTMTYQGGPSEAALNNSVSNVTAQVGGAAFLPCRVGHLGDRQISWIRSRDWHVLTSGNDLYTPDPRFSVLHEAGTQDWTLHIKYVTPRDNGTYECQVSTGTGIISLFVNLRIVTPIAHIPGRGQYHVNKDSPIVLTCVISKSPTPPHYVFWYHNGQLLNFLRNRPDFTITLEPQTPLVDQLEGGGVDDGLVSQSGTGVASISRLQMKHAEDRHSGNYTCSAPKTRPASTLVFVTEGDKTAAVQRIDSGSAGALCPTIHPLALLSMTALGCLPLTLPIINAIISKLGGR